jgi:hypothetical protein
VALGTSLVQPSKICHTSFSLVACGREIAAPTEQPDEHKPLFIWGDGGPCEKYQSLASFLLNCYPLSQYGFGYDPYSGLACPPGSCISTFPLGGPKSSKFNAALNSLSALGGQCAAAASQLTSLLGDSRISWWVPEDFVANGDRIYGTTWPASAPSTTIFAVHFWGGSFNLPSNQFLWLVAHEAYHVMNPHTGSETAADAFGVSCGGVAP